jgi:hypothetical protein
MEESKRAKKDVRKIGDLGICFGFRSAALGGKLVPVVV